VGAEGTDFKFVRHPSLKFFYAFVCAAAAAFTVGAQSPSRASIAKASGASAAEERTAKYLASVRERPLELMGFLERMPKGGDLHHHLTGAVYAESYINYAVEDGD